MDPQFFSLILLVAVFYFLLIRPQQVRNRKHRELLAALGEGDRVVTIGGLNGTVVTVKGDTVLMRIAEGVEIEVDTRAIAAVKSDEVAVNDSVPTEPDASTEEDPRSDD